MYDIIIIGAGPAGMSSALFALRAGKKILLLDSKGYGGRIINAKKIENYPAIETISGYDFATNLYNQITKLGAKISYEKVIKIEKNKVLTKEHEYNTKAIIIATGSENKKLKLPNEDNFIGKGISYCATCDGNFFKNKTVAITGNNNETLEETIYLSSLVSKIYLITENNSLIGDTNYIDEINKTNNIEIIYNSKITNLNGNNKLESITINDNNIINVDGLFISIGTEPRNEIFSNVVELNKLGYIKSIDGIHTKTDKIYVAGDARDKELRQLVTAVSDGSLAATIAIREMEK